MCPPGVDQTERTCQRWHLITPKLEEHISIEYPASYPVRSHDSPASSLGDNWSFDAFHMLTGPLNEAYTPESVTPAVKDARLSPLETLPAELLMTILEQNLEWEDKISLGFCSSTLWSYALKEIAAQMRRTQSNWAGSSLICTGNYLKDLPPSILDLIPNYAEQERLFNERSQGRAKGLGRRRNGKCPARRWISDCIGCFRCVPHREHPIHMIMRAFSGVCKEEESIGTELKHSLQRAIRWRKADQSGVWVLRNLTAKEFVMLDVRDDGLLDVKATVKGASWLSLDRAILQRICWSRFDGDWYEEEAERKVQERCHRGIWAGHSFDVVCEAVFSADGWQDVRDAILEEAKAARLLRCDFGSPTDYEHGGDEEA